MAHGKLPNYIRTHRKKMDLNQDQVAFLLGCKSGSKVCRYEQFEREPSLRTALAFEVIFTQSIREVFSGIYEEVERNVSKRARILANRLKMEDRRNGNRQPDSSDSLSQ